MPTTWALIADACKANIFQYQGPNNPLKLIHSMEHKNKLTRDLVSSERGRTSGPGNGQRAAMEPTTDPHEHEKAVFARELSQYLEKHVEGIDRLVVAAAPKFLGELRLKISKRVNARIDGVLDKDLTNIPENELPKHLSAVLNIG